MNINCGYCGTSLDADSSWRWYPEDDTVLCEKCFPINLRGSSGKTAPIEGPNRLVSAKTPAVQ